MIFRKDLIELVARGEKTQTRRKHKRTLNAGRIYAVKLNWFKETGLYLRITRACKQRLGDITQEDAAKEGFSGVEEFKAKWIHINGSWDPELIVTVYDFELAEKDDKTQSKLA